MLSDGVMRLYGRQNALSSLGFGFHEDNIRRFNYFLPDALKGKDMCGTLRAPFGYRNQVLRRLSTLGIDTNKFPGNSDCDHYFNFYFAFEVQQQSPRLTRDIGYGHGSDEGNRWMKAT